MTNKFSNLIVSPPSIAIIGGGLSGALVAYNLLRNTTIPLSIQLIEKSPEIGLGVAYRTKDPGHLLNVPASKISALTDDPDHFLHWLWENGYKQVEPSTFVPRRVYGQYIEALLKEALHNAMVYARLEIITDEAVALKTTPQECAIFLKGGRVLSAQKVVLALGNFPASWPAKLQLLENLPQQAKDAWDIDICDDLNSENSVLLVGTGLTMIDVVISLHRKGFNGKIYAVSRHGLMPQSHQPTEPYPTFLDPQTAPKTALGLFQRVRKEVKSAKDRGVDWRAVINALRPITQQLWQSLPEKEQKRFLRHIKPYWEVYRHRVAEEVAEIINSLINSGQLNHYGGRIESCHENEGKLNINICERTTGNNISLQVDRIINCTGSNCNYPTLKDPLIQNLLESGLITPHPLSIGLQTAANGAVISADGNVSQMLYTLGTPRKGDLWETTAVPEIRTQAAITARDLLQTLQSQSLISLQGKLPKDISILPNYSRVNAKTSGMLFRQLFDKESSTYTYLIADAQNTTAILVDPVLEQVERDLQVLRELGLTLGYCLETHIHADHITGANRLKQLTGCLTIFPENANSTNVDEYIKDGLILQLGSIEIKAIPKGLPFGQRATPGHTDSHMAYLINQTHLLTGDALLIRGCGRTDFQNGSAATLYDTVTQKLFTLPEETLVYPCHDYLGRTVSSIGEEKRWNPRFAGRSKEQFIELMDNLNLPYPKKMTTALPANQRGGKVLFVLDYQI